MSQQYQDNSQNPHKIDEKSSYLNQDDGFEMEPSQLTTPHDQFENDLSPSDQNPYADRNFDRNSQSQQKENQSQNMPRQIEFNFNERFKQMTEASADQIHSGPGSEFDGVGSDRAISMPLSGPASDRQQYPSQQFSTDRPRFILKQQMDPEQAHDGRIEQSANASQFPLQMQSSFGKNQASIVQVRQQQVQLNGPSPRGPSPRGPSPLARQLTDKVRTQAERLQIMEAYKALCERRILDFDPEHQLPVLPCHLGTGSISPQPGGPNSPAELKRLLALKEQDLLYTKQRSEKLSQELELIKNGGNRANGNMEALRQEIELNEKLQKQVEAQEARINQLATALQSQQSQERQGTPTGGSPAYAHGIDPKQQSAISEFQGQLQAQKEQLEALRDEKNALLDYIDEHLGQDQSLSAQKKPSQSPVDVQKEQLCERNVQLQNELENMKLIVEELKIQNQSLMKAQYASPNFGRDKQVGPLGQEKPEEDSRDSDLPESIHGAENTFGNAEALQKQFEETKSRFILEKEQLAGQVEAYRAKVTSLEQDLAHIQKRHQELRSENGTLQQRLETANSEGQQIAEAPQSARSDSAEKRKCRDLELKLKATQENTKTLSETLNETQAELERLVKDHGQLAGDLQREVREHKQTSELYQSNQSLVGQLVQEKAKLQEQYLVEQSANKALGAEIQKAEKETQQEKERADQYERHIRELKSQEQMRIESVTVRWEETVGDLSKELENAKRQVKERSEIYSKLEDELRKKVEGTDVGKQEKTKLMEKIEDLSAELQLLKGQKQEKDSKLKNQIRKNEELLGELQDLSEAVNALKNDKDFTINSQMLEEREKVIEEYQHYLSNKQKRAIDRIFSTILKSVESIRDFSGVYQILRTPPGANCASPQNIMLFDQIDQSLKNIAQVQQLQQEQACKDLKNRADSEIKAYGNLFKDLECLTRCLGEWNDLIIGHFKSKVTELNDTQKQLFAEADLNKTLQGQVQKQKFEETQNQQKDQTIQEDLQCLQLTMIQKEREMKDAYKREDKLQRQNHKIKVQLDTLVKEQEKLVLQIKALVKDQERLTSANEELMADQEKDESRVRTLEYQLSSAQGQMNQVNHMVENLKTAMPSEDLQRLVSELQQVTLAQFQLSEDFTLKESQLLSMENQLRQFAKMDTGLSQKVIQLRKDIQQSRNELKQLQARKSQEQERYEEVVEQLRNCESSERRRNDVALETEKALMEARELAREQQKEMAFVNKNRNDLEIAVYGLQEQNGMLQRELAAIRSQLASGTYSGAQATLGGTFARMKTARERSGSAAAGFLPLNPSNLLGPTGSQTTGHNTHRASPLPYRQASSHLNYLQAHQPLTAGFEPEQVAQPGQLEVLAQASQATRGKTGTQEQQTFREVYAQHVASAIASPPAISAQMPLAQPNPYYMQALNIDSSQKNFVADGMLPNQDANAIQQASYNHQASAARPRSMSLGNPAQVIPGPHNGNETSLFENEMSYINASSGPTQNVAAGLARGNLPPEAFYGREENSRPLFTNSLSENFSSEAGLPGHEAQRSYQLPPRHEQGVLQRNAAARASRNEKDFPLSSFDKNQRVTLSEQFKDDSGSRTSAMAAALDPQQMPILSQGNPARQVSNQRLYTGESNNDYGTFGGMSGREKTPRSGGNQLPSQRQADAPIQPSPSMANVASDDLSNERGPRQTTVGSGQKCVNAKAPSRPDFRSLQAPNPAQSSISQTLVTTSVAQQPTQEKERHPYQEDLPEADDSFRTEDGAAGENLEDNSLLMKSEFLQDNHAEGSLEERPNSSLQNKLSQVKNVFTAIRQNLNEGSTQRSYGSNQNFQN